MPIEKNPWESPIAPPYFGSPGNCPICDANLSGKQIPGKLELYYVCRRCLDVSNPANPSHLVDNELYRKIRAYFNKQINRHEWQD